MRCGRPIPQINITHLQMAITYFENTKSSLNPRRWRRRRCPQVLGSQEEPEQEAMQGRREDKKVGQVSVPRCGVVVPFIFEKWGASGESRDERRDAEEKFLLFDVEAIV